MAFWLILMNTGYILNNKKYFKQFCDILFTKSYLDLSKSIFLYSPEVWPPSSTPANQNTT